MLRGSARFAQALLQLTIATGARRAASSAGNLNGQRVILDRGVLKKAKDCALCGRTMTWRKKWERDWEQVRYCSQRCKGQARRAAKQLRGGAETEP